MDKMWVPVLIAFGSWIVLVMLAIAMHSCVVGRDCLRPNPHMLQEPDVIILDRDCY